LLAERIHGAKQGIVSNAAVRLRIAQSALSRQIKELEEELKSLAFSFSIESATKDGATISQQLRSLASQDEAAPTYSWCDTRKQQMSGQSGAKTLTGHATVLLGATISRRA
jgi:DNA-binding transcriptional LysR family regulator